MESTLLDGAPLERIRLPDKKNAARTSIYYSGLLEVCQRAAEGPVVAQLLTNMRPQALPWIEQLKAAGVASLYSVSQFPTWQQKPLKRILRTRGYREVYNAFDALVTNSEAIKQFLRDIGVTSRIEYIPNGVNLGRFHPPRSTQDIEAREALRAKLGIREGHKVIAAVGAVMPRKGQDKILGAWRRILPQLPDTDLLFVGPRSDIHDPKLKDFGEEIHHLISTSAAPEQVHFTGIVDDVDNYLRAADLLILASGREGTPNSVLEGMATGLPCLVTPFLGLSEGIGRADQHYRLVDREEEAIAAALTETLQDTSRGQSLAQNGLRYAIEQVDQEKTLDRYAALYEELAAQHYSAS
ncbi:MAG: glycosyltransferase family 4 protein [Halieaceae bacterium]|nr:glycosyltransferase family 4 protein [Halieaceae bacterium]